MSGRRCGVCTWTSPDGSTLPGWCPRCRGRTIADVADLPELWHTLAHQLAPGKTGEQQRVGGSRTPPLPLRVDIASLRGPAGVGRLQGPDQGGALSIATVLWCARQTVRDECGLPADLHRAHITDVGAGVAREAKFLHAWLDRYAEKAPPEALAQLVDDLHQAREQAWRACGYGAHKIRLGPCPAEYEPGLTCGTELWIDPVLDDSVRCRDCGTRWDRRYFLWLRRMAGEQEEAG